MLAHRSQAKYIGNGSGGLKRSADLTRIRSMYVLAIDTCTEPGSVALARDAELLESPGLPAGLRSDSLHVELLRLLRSHALTTADVHAYAVTSGPGSFTGVRLGMTAAKGLAEVHRKPIAAVSTLEAIAMAAQRFAP